MRVKNWRLWRTRTRVIVSVAALAALVAGAVYVAWLTNEPMFTAAAATIAAASLAVAAVTAVSGVNKSKRKDTLEAWTKWADGNREVRQDITAALGRAALSAAEAKALNLDGPLVHMTSGKELTAEELRQLQDKCHFVLNGLERLAVGVELGIYDEKVLYRMGRTIIVRTWERFMPYIQLVRNEPDDKKRQKNAYIELDVLVKMLRALDAAGESEEIDRARLEALR